jgi:hypothetical protein
MAPDETVEDDPTEDEEPGPEEEDGTEQPSDGWGDDFASDHDGPAAFPMPGLSGALSRGVAGGLGQSPVILEPKNSTPFEVAEAGHAVPTSALWAMKYLRHGRYGLSSGDDGPGRIRWASDEVTEAGGTDDATDSTDVPDEPNGPEAEAGPDESATEDDVTGSDEGGPVYVIDDGSDHCMVARLVGSSPDGCTYSLVARIKRPDFDDVRAGWAPATDLFTRGKEFTLCGVVEGSVSNVVRVAGYRRYKHVPVEYLPPSPFIRFDEAI